MIASFTVLVLLIIIYAVSENVLSNSFGNLEQKNVHDNVEHAVNALDREVSGLSAFVYDWSAWDDSYAFVEDVNQAFVDANLVDGTFVQNRLNFMVFVNSSGYVVFAKVFDLQNRTEIPFSQNLQSSLFVNDLLWRFTSTDDHADGIVVSQEGPVFVSSRPIITSNYTGPIRGAVMMGRNLDSREIQSLSEQLHLPLTIQKLNDPQLPSDLQVGLTQDSIFIKPTNSDYVAGYALLKDIYGNPGLVLRTDLPREIFKQGLATLSYLTFALLGSGLVFAALFLLLLQKLVLQRLAQLSKAVKQIGKSGNLSQRVSLKGKDELSDLSSEFNNMLSALQDSRHKLEEYSEHLEDLVKERTEALSRSEERIRGMFSASPDAITATDLEGNIIECNDRTVEMQGYPSRDELIGRNALQMIAKRDHQRAMRNLRRTLEHGTVSGVEYTLVRRDGQEFPTELSASIVRNGSGKPVGFVAITRDISERRKMEQQLLSSRRLAAIGELAGMVGHDLRNPLAGMKGAVYYLKNKYGQGMDDKAREMLEIVDSSIEDSNKIINDLLDYSREIHLQREETTPRALIEKSLSLTTIPANIQLVNQTWDEPTIHVDVDKLKRGFSNIITNSIDAMPEGGKLELGSKESGDYVKFTFSDTGVGMTEETIAKLWNPLFTTKARGMGFGLSICKRIVEAHDGRIRVKSTVGRGSTFQIVIPFRPATNEPDTAPIMTSRAFLSDRVGLS
jgi:PAS domain S-box-containing protein